MSEPECMICYGKGHYPEDFDSFCFACMGSGIDPDWTITYDLVVQLRYGNQPIGRRVSFRGPTIDVVEARARSWAERNIPDLKARAQQSAKPKPKSKKKRLVLKRKKGK